MYIAMFKDMYILTGRRLSTRDTKPNYTRVRITEADFAVSV